MSSNYKVNSLLQINEAADIKGDNESVCSCYILNKFISKNPQLCNQLSNRGYFMAARGYEFYLRVLKVSLTSERSERVRDTFSTRR